MLDFVKLISIPLSSVNLRTIPTNFSISTIFSVTSIKSSAKNKPGIFIFSRISTPKFDSIEKTGTSLGGPGQKRRAVGHKRQHVINRRLRVLPTCLEWLHLSRRARDTTAARLHHSRHRGESATKTIKFFVAHTVNYVICNNHTRIDWVLLNFTPVIQQNYHQPGRKFEKLFCAVDRLSCENPKPANSEAILFLIS